MKFNILFMFTMILLPLREVMVPQEEIDPGPCPPSISLISKLNYLPTLILSEVLVIFRTWISYIDRLIPWSHKKLKFISAQVASISFEAFDMKSKFKKKYSSTMPVHLYHDHYMIDVFITSKKIYLYHDHYMIGMLVSQAKTIHKKNLNHHKSGKTFHHKAVRFKN